MSCPGVRVWELVAMGLLEAGETREKLAHARSCPACRDRLQAARQAHLDQMEMYQPFSRNHEVLREELLANLPARVPRHRSPRLLWTRLPASFAGRRAAAILLPAAGILVVLVMSLLPRQQSAFAAAIEHLCQASNIVCRITTRITPELDTAGPDRVPLLPSQLKALTELPIARIDKLYVNPDHGSRRDSYLDGALISTVYVAPNGRTHLLDRIHRTCTAFEVEEPVELLDEHSPDDGQPTARERPFPLFSAQQPEQLIRGLQALSEDAGRALGNETLNGRELIGFEVAGNKVGLEPPWMEAAPENRAELWVDSQTGVPVRVAFEFMLRPTRLPGLPTTGRMKFRVEFDQFEWEATLPTDWFTPVIPDGFTDQTDLNSNLLDIPTEASLIEGLKLYKELAGRYPESLSMLELGKQISALAIQMSAEPSQSPESNETDPVAGPKSKLFRLGGLTYFILLQQAGQEPEYHGCEGTPDDADKVLMSWSLDGGRTRLLYGDLHTETIAADTE